MARTQNAKGAEGLKETPKSEKPFRFRDLPIEIQLNIFQMFLPTKAPEPKAKDLVESHEYANERCCSFYVVDDETIARKQGEASKNQDAFNMLPLNTSTFKDFAPHYHQYRSLVFSEPFRFSNEFLSRVTDPCLYNLRYLTCKLDEKQNHWAARPHPKLQKLEDLIQA